MELLIIFGLILINGIFSTAEMAIVTARKSRLKQMANEGNLSAKSALDIANNPNRFLSTVQVGITFVAIIAGVFAGDSLTKPLTEFFTQFPTISPYSEAIAYVILIVFITFLSLVFGELVPKRIALNNPEKIASFFARPMSILSKFMNPVVGLLTFSTDIILKILRINKNPKDSALSEEEIKIILAQSVGEGVLEKEEVDMVNRVFKLADTPVKEVMIPKSKIIGIEIDTPITKVIDITRKHTHSRFPVYKNSINNIIGLVHVKDIYSNLITDKKTFFIKDIYRAILRLNKNENKLSDLKIIRKMPSVLEKTKIDDVLIMQRAKGIHMAIVRGENSNFTGVVALEDIIEKLVGEIKDEFDEKVSA